MKVEDMKVNIIIDTSEFTKALKRTKKAILIRKFKMLLWRIKKKYGGQKMKKCDNCNMPTCESCLYYEYCEVDPTEEYDNNFYDCWEKT